MSSVKNRESKRGNKFCNIKFIILAITGFATILLIGLFSFNCSNLIQSKDSNLDAPLLTIRPKILTHALPPFFTNCHLLKVINIEVSASRLKILTDNIAKYANDIYYVCTNSRAQFFKQPIKLSDALNNITDHYNHVQDKVQYPNGSFNICYDGIMNIVKNQYYRNETFGELFGKEHLAITRINRMLTDGVYRLFTSIQANLTHCGIDNTYNNLTNTINDVYQSKLPALCDIIAERADQIKNLLNWTEPSFTLKECKEQISLRSLLS